ncbi:hypothetical protein [Flavobacterium ammonificans]|jgi:hypothetical protein|uniref:hypothetical protein n=1 Tax=Flavobacterium ammonificans TaxID=1751056 RepID=UPI001E588FA2|nr:hypothetical protein [Flavobacterium ammonificans]BDB57175.1 hypothetical protein SHINM13_14710 [Flavobacterium ammonificans]
MKTIEFYLNIVHFYFFKSFNKFNLYYKKISPSRLIFKIPAIKNKAEKENINLNQIVDTVLNNKNFGLSITFAGGFLFGLLFIFFFGILGIFRKIYTTTILEKIHFIVIGVLSAIICYIFIFNKNRYLKYFETFEKWTKEEKRNYSWLTFAVIIIILLFWFLSF